MTGMEWSHACAFSPAEIPAVSSGPRPTRAFTGPHGDAAVTARYIIVNRAWDPRRTARKRVAMPWGRKAHRDRFRFAKNVGMFRGCINGQVRHSI